VVPFLVEVFRERLGRLDDVAVAVDDEVFLAELLGRRTVCILDRLVPVGGFLISESAPERCIRSR